MPVSFTRMMLSTEVTYPFSDGFFAQLWENQLLVWSLKNYEQSSRQCKNTIYCLKGPWWYKVWPHHFWLWKMPAILKPFFSVINYFLGSSLSACKCVCVCLCMCVHASQCVCAGACMCACMDVCVPFTFCNSLKPVWTCHQYEQVQFNTGDQNIFDRS